MEKSSVLQVREFDRARDYVMVRGWWEAHGKAAPPLAILPALGVIVCGGPRDLAALWLYLDNSVGVCFAEKMVTTPGLSLAEARRALEFGLRFLRGRAAAMDYGVMVIHAYAATARYLRKMRFVESDGGLACLWAFTKEKEEESNG